MTSIEVEFTVHNLKIKLLNKEILFNKNILYCLDLDTYESVLIKKISQLDDIYKKKKYFIFTSNFIGNNLILKNLSSNFNLNFIEYSVRCFWCMVVIEGKFFEKINVKLKNFSIDYSSLESQNNNFVISENIYYEIEKLNSKINDYKKSILNESLQNIKNQQNKIKNNMTKIEVVLKNIKSNVDSINTLKDNEIINLVEQKEIIMNDIKYLKKQKEKEQTFLEEIKLEHSIEKQKYDEFLILKENEIEFLNKKSEDLKNELTSKYLMSTNTLSNTIERRKLAIMVHMFNISLWDDIYNFVNNLENFNIDIDLYVNLSVNEPQDLEKKEYKILKEKINKTTLFKNIYFSDSDNRGMDIGGFFISCCKMFDMGLRYDSIIKIHSKTNDSWRFAMLYALLGNEKIIKNNLKLMRNREIGMIGNNVLSINNVLSVNQRSYKYIFTYMDYFNIKETENLGYFVPGTIFWIKGDILEKHFTKELILKCYNEFEQNYCGSLVNNREGKPHAFERFFGVMVNDTGLKTVPFDYRV